MLAKKRLGIDCAVSGLRGLAERIMQHLAYKKAMVVYLICLMKVIVGHRK